MYGGLGIFEFYYIDNYIDNYIDDEEDHNYIDLINYFKMINQSKKNTKLNIF